MTKPTFGRKQTASPLNVINPFIEGPPCLQTLFDEGFPKGTWKLGMLNVGTFCKLSDPEHWEERLVQINRLTFPDETKYPTSDLTDTIQSLSARNYRYMCTDYILRSRCDEKTCKGREFGVDAAHRAKSRKPAVRGQGRLFNVQREIR